METSQDTRPKGPHTVLIVEDDAFLAKTYEAKLHLEGSEVWIARDGEEAMELLRKEKPSLVLLDLMLPLVSGFDVLEAVRKDQKWEKVPVVVLTNLGQPQDRERAEKLGIVKYIVKVDAKIGDVVEEVKKCLI